MSILLKITQDQMFLTIIGKHLANKSSEKLTASINRSIIHAQKISSSNPLTLHKIIQIILKLNSGIEHKTGILRYLSYVDYPNECIIAIVSRYVTKRYSRRVSADRSS